MHFICHEMPNHERSFQKQKKKKKKKKKDMAYGTIWNYMGL